MLMTPPLAGIAIAAGKPLAIDLCCGLGGWTEGFLLEGWDVIGYDIEEHVYGEHRYPAHLVLQDIRTLDGRQFKGKASVIVASPPCQKYSYMAMPFSRGKKLRQEYLDGTRSIDELNELFNNCFRIADEAELPIIVENVRGAQEWLGPSRWNYGSFHLWGDVPALMPISMKTKVADLPQLSAHSDPRRGRKNSGGSWFNVAHNPARHVVSDGGVKGFTPHGQPLGKNELGRLYGSKSPQRKAASALIAKIPLPLSRHIARVFKPHMEQGANSMTPSPPSSQPQFTERGE